jgi:hypothetical protein
VDAIQSRSCPAEGSVERPAIANRFPERLALASTPPFIPNKAGEFALNSRFQILAARQARQRASRNSNLRREVVNRSQSTSRPIDKIQELECA